MHEMDDHGTPSVLRMASMLAEAVHPGRQARRQASNEATHSALLRVSSTHP